MHIEIETILVLVFILLWLDILIVLRTLANKTNLALSAERRSKELAELAHLFEIDSSWDKKKVKRLFDNYLRLKQSIDLPQEERRRILSLAGADKKEPRLARNIRHWSRYMRMEATLGLGLIASDSARLTLEGALFGERDYPTRLYIANALADIGDLRSVPLLVDSLLGAHRWYREKVNALIASFGLEAIGYLRTLFDRKENEIEEMLIDVAGQIVSQDLRDYLIVFVDGGVTRSKELAAQVEGCAERSCAYCVHGRSVGPDGKRDCRYEGKVAPSFVCRRWKLLISSKAPVANQHRLMTKAAECLEEYYSSVLDDDRYLRHEDPAIRAIAVRSLGKGTGEAPMAKLVGFLAEDEVVLPAKLGLTAILTNHPPLTPSLVNIFDESKDPVIRQRLAEVLAARIEYFVAKLASKEGKASVRLIRELLQLGKAAEIIEFLKINKDEDIENELLALLGEEIPQNEGLKVECCRYLPDRILGRLGLTRVEASQRRREEKKDPKMVTALYGLLFFSIALFPALYLLRYGDTMLHLPALEQLKTFIVDFNYDFAYYSIAVNLTYLILMALSVVKVRSSTRLWNLKTMSLLFKPRMLPSVSIIAPAFNESKTIIESANSLLNLKYPDYELVIVNDGSKDSTLETLISYYSLVRTEYYFVQRLKAAKVRGIYRNPLYPRLVVVDKENGGKADSLNAGMNVASKEYFCGIDADSLLEPDALLKVASLTLDYGVETPAMGGNVFPINGCTVDRGKLTKLALPENNLARLQTIEYLRAFMCGRLGWAELNGLLIISGAFGLFRKERMVSIGGYLTSSERYGRDTVGEDMELVVRVSRLMHEKRQKFRIGYAYNANCWTEVPETMKVLKRQRDRWHRGLLDIMYLHRKLLFNPAYGRIGLISMPYFLVFEVAGPLFEIQGYLMVLLAAVFGLMSTKLALLLFVASVMMGILISMSSVLIAERQLSYFSYRDTLRMLAIAFLENFGPRQLFSMWRVLGFFSAMKKPQGWGKMERKGFSGGQNSVAAGGGEGRKT